MPDIRVPQKDGSITVSRSGDKPVTRSVSDHIVQVGDADVEHFLATVEGSSLVADTAKKEK